MYNQIFEKIEVLCPNLECKIERTEALGGAYCKRPKLRLIMIGLFGNARFQCPRCQKHIDIIVAGDASEVTRQYQTKTDNHVQKIKEG